LKVLKPSTLSSDSTSAQFQHSLVSCATKDPPTFLFFGLLVERHDGGERQRLIDGITTTIYYTKIPTVR